MLVIVFAAFIPVSGCAQEPGSARRAVAVDVSPSVAEDYPGWVLIEDRGEAVSRSVGTGSSKTTFVRVDHMFLLRSPDGSMTILAWYARSAASDSEIVGRTWTNPDHVYKGSGWNTPLARSLYLEMKEAHPSELLLGAFRTEAIPGSSEVFRVGFYEAPTGDPGIAFRRGEHVYQFSSQKDEWTQLEYDSGSDDTWSSGGAVQ